jgi:PAS domain S-box-containing protein
MAKNKKTLNPPWQQSHLLATSDWRLPASPDFLGIFQSAREAMFLVDGRGIIRFWNLGAQLLFGYSGDEIINSPVESLIQGGWPVHDNGEKSRNEKFQGNAQVTKLIEVTGLRKDGFQFQLEISIGGESSGGGGLGLIFARDLTERAQKNEQVNDLTQERLQYRIRFENLITSISTHFIHLPSEKVDKGISYALHTLGEFAGVDRAYIFLFSSDHATVDNSHEWCSKGVEPQLLHLQRLPVSRFPWFMDRIQSLNTIYVPNVLPRCTPWLPRF